ncbi:uncharacterized protein LOC128557286 [Mercenaria mercenaria]|uniref:uncharacterized protein LOC128557286 n=1 Tax=Mercenaria mercenaria TaxID=6596 RepID=UPI00234EDDBA|nr:uncharacterized protein LOC128557286 [Mercenaria mercenaria]
MYIRGERKTYIRTVTLFTAYRVPVAESITGNRSVYLQGALQPVDAKQQKDYTLTMIANTYTSAKTFIWKLLNFGRTVSMVGLEIYRPDGGKIKTDNERFSFFRCFYGRDKWSFLYFGSLLCPFQHSFIDDNKVLQILFTRAIEGRYIALVFTTASSSVLQGTRIDLYTRRTSYYSKATVMAKNPYMLNFK